MRLKANASEYTDALIERLFALGVLLFFAAYVWANFFCRYAYNADMYADVTLAQLIYENKTLFPDGWIYGNQYSVISTPVVAALFCGLTGDAALSMSIASTLMTAAQLLLFLWMIRPFVSRSSALAALFAISGAVMLGTSVIHYTSGMQLLYSMASYYACYMIGIYLTLGVWLRLLNDIRVPIPVILVSLFVCAALGVQSLRETLVLIIPLALLDIVLIITRSGKSKSTGFSAAVCVSNLIGVYISKNINAVSQENYSGFSIPHSFSEIIANAKESLNSFLALTGFNFYNDGIKYLPLSLVSLLILAVIIIALASLILCSVRHIRLGKSCSPCVLNILLVFSFVSVLGVAAVGTFLGFSLRATYYFVYFLLAALSFAYLLHHLKRPIAKRCVSLLLLGCGFISLFYNVYPDAVQLRSQRECFYTAAEKLDQAGFNFYYFDQSAFSSSGIAACSSGKIDCTPVYFRSGDSSGADFYCTGFLTSTDFFTSEHISNSALVLAESRLGGNYSSLNRIEMNNAEDDILSKLELLFVVESEYQDFYVYRIIDPSVIVCID